MVVMPKLTGFDMNVFNLRHWSIIKCFNDENLILLPSQIFLGLEDLLGSGI
jgi:hypothetical protein